MENISPEIDLLSDFSRLNNELVNLQRDLHQKNEEISKKQNFIEKIINTSPNVMYLFDIKTGYSEFLNRIIEDLLGYFPENDRRYKNSLINCNIHPEDIDLVKKHIKKLLHLKENQVLEVEYRVADHSNNWIWINCRNTLFEVDSKKNPEKILGIALDVTERKIAQEKITFASFHDGLTGLYNRYYFNEEINRLQKSRLFPISIIMIDLDNLKVTNDQKGHKTGDLLIQKTAELLNNCFRHEDIIARVGGDEFVILLEKTDSIKLNHLIDRILNKLQDYKNRFPELNIDFSLGASTALEGESLIHTLKIADDKMYVSKMEKKKGGAIN